MNQKRDATRVLGVIILAVCMLAIGFAAGKLINVDVETSLRTITSEKPSLDLFWEVWGIMETEFVNSDEIDQEEKRYGAIKGLVDSYGDPATVFLTPEETETFNSTNEGKYFEGIGAELGYEDGYVIIISPLEGSPAKEAGIRPGDIILSVDGVEISKGDNIYDVVAMIRGEAGTDVTLEVLHKGDLELTEITITRGEITVPSMKVEFLQDDIAYLELARFTDASYLEWVNKWEQTTKEVLDRGVKKMILDLRGNPGGYFDAAIYAADEFLPGKETISIQENGQGRQKEFNSKNGGDLTDIELVILIDEGSASASEILSGALQYHDVAQIVGQSSYGKGTAQAIEDFRDGSSLHVTVFKWLLPDETWINRDNPIVPDYEVEYSTDDFTEGQDPQLDKAIELLN
ncbi:MAG: Carboxyl-terminal protease [candidate division WS6 bacterium 34_10]|uniref:Carboxyl-terminal protease n=1 Tax=candidate division WS6 bacterium 34_10 TaxID=1641389 RepID=A0A101HJA0_9BACT|nr:MAG: Carboxyl-terminal protease [candidate division WS6 bacterium 34_10]